MTPLLHAFISGNYDAALYIAKNTLSDVRAKDNWERTILDLARYELADQPEFSAPCA